MMSFKLALRNVKKSFRDYTVYFLTLTLGVCIFFIFNSIESQQAIMDLTSGQASILRLLDRVMTAFSVFVSAILGALILYANRFLIKRRKKEFGIYMTLGMEKGAMSRILIMETAFVGLVSLCAGAALGVFLSQGMAVITAKLLGASIGRFDFIFSGAALLKTVFCFGAIFLLALIFNVFSVRKQNLIDLIQAGRKNEKYKTPKLALSVVLFIASVCIIAVAYTIVLGDGLLNTQTLMPSIIMGVVGTFLFFFSLSGFFLKLLQRNKKVYLKNLNMFVLRQINSKINTTYISVSMVCLMLFISISALSSGIGLANNISKNTERNIPFDASLIAYGDFDEDGSLAGEYKGIDLIRAAEDAGVDLNAFAAQYRTTRLYDGGDEINRELSPRLFDFVPRFMKLSDYNELLDLRGIEPLALGRNEFALNSSYYDNFYMEDLKKFAESEPIVSIGGEQFRTNAALVFNRAQYVTQNPSMNATLIVRDEALEGADPVSDILQIVYKGEGSEYESSCREALASLRLPKDVNRSLETRASVRETSNTATTTIAYLSIYLGIVFLITAAAVLAISQLSETSDNIRRYSLLRKIGTDEGMIKKALFSQILIYFGVPLSLALVHAAVGIGVMNNLTGALGVGGILDTGLFMVALMLIVYGGYFLATYFGGKNIIDRGAAKDG